MVGQSKTKRNHSLTIRLTKEEKFIIEERAKSFRISVSQYMRLRLLKKENMSAEEGIARLNKWLQEGI